MEKMKFTVSGGSVGRFLLGLVAALVVVFAITLVSFAFFSPGDSDDTVAASLTTLPPSTEAAIAAATTTTTTTTTMATTTTTLPPGPVVTVATEGAPAGFDDLVASLYAWAGGGDEPPEASEELLAALAGAADFTALELAGEANSAELPEIGEVLVAVFDEDVVLAVDDGSGWRIVGAKLARFGLDPLYGRPVRMAMIIGSDARPGENQQRLRADSLHLATTVPAEGAGAIVGFPRDSWVRTPYGGETKFAHVMAGRGPEVVLETARNLTGLPIEGYVVTGFMGFTGLVDEFGGLAVDIPFGMSDEASQAFFREGLQRLMGPQALAFSRNRHIGGGDLTRSFHQGVVIHAGLVAVQERGILVLPDLLALLLRHAWTDFDAEELLTLAAATYEMEPGKVTNQVVPASLGRVGSASVVFLGDGAQAIFRDLEDDGLITPEADD